MGVPDHPVVHTPERPGDVRRHCADITLARQLLAYEPRSLSDEDLSATVEWYRGRLA